MPCSEKQAESNRINALHSTGPRTPEGKIKSRANGFKHGLTGAGIVLPTEDAEEVDARFATLEAEMKPGNELARQLVLRMALMLVKLDRSAQHEAKAITHRMRRAEAEFVDARLAEVDDLYSWIASEPATNARRLRSTPEGMDRLIGAMEGLRSDLGHPHGHRWEWQHCEQFHHLLGLRSSDLPVGRAKALTEAIFGNFKFLEKDDGAGLEGDARRRWAGGTLLDLLDGELAKLRTLREGFDLDSLDLERSEAKYRAMFDASPEAVLARKYESANERSLYRALKEFREIQPEDPEVDMEPVVAPEPPEELASSLPEPSEDEVGVANIDPIVMKAGHAGPARGASARSGRPSTVISPPKRKSRRR